MIKAIRWLIVFLLSIAVLIGIRALNLPVLLSLLLAIPATVAALIGILSVLNGKEPGITGPKSR
jgi:hypothetical protein